MHMRKSVKASLSVKNEITGRPIPMIGYIYKENKEFIILYPFFDREKDFSWLDKLRFKVIPVDLIEQTYERTEETFFVFDELDEKWKFGHEPYHMPLHVIQIKGKCPSKKAKSSLEYGQRIKQNAKRVFGEPIPEAGKVEVTIDFFTQGEVETPDIDNAAKLILDSLIGTAYNDDKQVKKVTVESHDTSKLIVFERQPILLIDPLMEGTLEYTVIRVNEQDTSAS